MQCTLQDEMHHINLLPEVKEERKGLAMLSHLKTSHELVCTISCCQIKVCVALTHLNDSVKHESHILPSVGNALAQVRGAIFLVRWMQVLIFI